MPVRIVLGRRQIAVPLTSQLRLETVRQSSTVTGEVFALKVNGGTKGGGFMVAVRLRLQELKVKRFKSKCHDFRSVQKACLQSGLFASEAKFLYYDTLF